jgi:hypothetical protein
MKGNNDGEVQRFDSSCGTIRREAFSNVYDVQAEIGRYVTPAPLLLADIYAF